MDLAPWCCGMGWMGNTHWVSSVGRNYSVVTVLMKLEKLSFTGAHGAHAFFIMDWCGSVY